MPRLSELILGSTLQLQASSSAADIDISQDGQWVAVAYGSGTPRVGLLSNTNGTLASVSTYTPAGAPNAVAFSPDGLYVAVGHAGGDRVTLLHNIAGTLSLATTYALSGTCTGVRFTPDGLYLVCVTGWVITVLSRPTAATLALDSSAGTGGPTINHVDASNDASWSVATAETNGGAGVADIKSHTIGSLSGEATYATAAPCLDIALAVELGYVAQVAGSVLRVNQLTGGLASYDTYTAGSTIQGVAVSRDRLAVAIAFGTGVQVLNISSAHTLSSAATHTVASETATKVRFGKTGNWLVYCGIDATSHAVATILRYREVSTETQPSTFV